jgi:4-amino-4-deoxy-L-arabinose transferase-like glycosyltransferase
LYLVVALTGLAFALRVVGLDFQSLWRDEVDAIRFAGRPLADLLQTFATPGQNGPLYYLLLRPWLEVAGGSEFALRFFSAAFGVLAVPLIYRLARRIWPRQRGLALVAALVAATSPYLVWYGQEGKMYSLVVALALISMERYLAALEGGGWHRWLAYVAATTAAFYVHLVAVLLVPVQFLAFFLQGRARRRARWKPWLACMALLIVPYLPLLAWQWRLLAAPAASGYAFVPLHDMLYSLVASFSLGYFQANLQWVLVLFVGLLLVSALCLKERHSARAWLLLLAWLVVPAGLLFLVTLIRPMYTTRYLIFVLPAYLLLLAAGWGVVARRSRGLAALWLAALLVANGWGLWVQARTPFKADFRAATRYVVAGREAGDLILFQIPYGRHSFDYYLARQGGEAVPEGGENRIFVPVVARRGLGRPPWAEGPYTNGGMAPAEVDRLMAELTAGRRTVWLVATEVALWDARGLTQAWLEENARRVAEAHFERVDVYRYELPAEDLPESLAPVE